uniref:Uncharacterized protein n=1 Tax=Fundulus heteroclitus TaxID=8078 RepID=A0A3Q2NRK9_FUNHE
ISGSMSSRGAALFRSPTSSSNSEANTEDGRWIVASWWSHQTEITGAVATSSEGPDASFRCCR